MTSFGLTKMKKLHFDYEGSKFSTNLKSNVKLFTFGFIFIHCLSTDKSMYVCVFVFNPLVQTHHKNYEKFLSLNSLFEFCPKFSLSVVYNLIKL